MVSSLSKYRKNLSISRSAWPLYIPLLSLWLESSCLAASAPVPHIEWTRHHQTSVDAVSHDVAIGHGGEVYVTGYTDDTQLGPAHGGLNSFLNKYNSSGSLQWTKSIDLGYTEQSHCVEVDTVGNVYISGFTGGASDGTSEDSRDIFLNKYSSAGDFLWSQRLGSPWMHEAPNAMTINGAGIYLSGYTDSGLGETSLGERDAFVAKYDLQGTLLWKQLIGSETRDESYGVEADSKGNVYVTSQTSVPIGSGITRRWVSFVSKFDPDGNLLWRYEQANIGPFGDDSAVLEGISLDTLGNIFLSGITSQGGSSFAGFLRRLDADGIVDWTRRFTLLSDTSVATDNLGNVFLSGTDYYGRDQILFAASVMKLSGDGQILWSQKTVNSGSDFSNAIATDGLGTIYIAGDSYDGRYRPNNFPSYAYVTKFSEVPEPSTLALVGIPALVMFLKRR